MTPPELDESLFQLARGAGPTLALAAVERVLGRALITPGLHRAHHVADWREPPPRLAACLLLPFSRRVRA